MATAQAAAVGEFIGMPRDKIDEVKLAGPIVYVKLYGATNFEIQYTNYRQPY